MFGNSLSAFVALLVAMVASAKQRVAIKLRSMKRDLDLIVEAGLAMLGTPEPRETSLAADDRAIMREVRLIGGGLIMVLIVTLVLTEVHEAAAVESGPFSNVTTSLENTGVSALILLIVGFLVIAATAIMRFFGGGFGGR